MTQSGRNTFQVCQICFLSEISRFQSVNVELRAKLPNVNNLYIHIEVCLGICSLLTNHSNSWNNLFIASNVRSKVSKMYRVFNMLLT